MGKQQPIEIILLRQWASHMAMPVWIAGERGGFINQQLNTKGIPRTSVVSTIAQEVIPAFA